MLIVAAWALMRLASETSYAAIVGALRATEPWRVAVAVLLTVASFGLLTLYDLNAFASIGKPQPWRRIAPGAVAAYAVAQTAGFGPLSGGAVRLRYYTPLGVTPADIARVVVFVVAAFGLGLTLTAAAGGLVAAPHLAAVLGVRTATVGVVAAAVLAAALVLIAGAGRGFVVPGTGGRRFELPGRMLMIRQLAVTALDTAAAGGVLWVLLPAHTVSYVAFLPIYAVALALGILSHVPAGLGVFEAVMLAALSGLAPPAEILAAFALYRLIYQVLPLAVAAAGLALAEGRALAAHGPTAAALKAVAGLAPPVLATMALVLGTMLVFSGVTPAQPDDLDWLGSFLPLHVIEGAHFLASVLGALLLISARGLAFRADGAWWAAMVAACAALVLSLLKAVAVYEAAALALFAAALFVARGAFDRRSALFGLRLTPPWIAAVAVVLVSAFVILRFVFDHAEFGAESWLRFELSAEAPRGQRALFGASLLACLFALWSLLRPVRDAGVPLTDADLERAIAIIAAQPVAGANLVRMGDKRLLLSDGRPGLRHVRPAGQLVDRALRPGRAGRRLGRADLAIRRDRPQCRLPRGLLPGRPRAAGDLCRRRPALLQARRAGAGRPLELRAHRQGPRQPAQRPEPRRPRGPGGRARRARRRAAAARRPRGRLRRLAEGARRRGEGLLARRLRPGLRRRRSGSR